MVELAAAAGSDFPRFDPGALVAAVNSLLPMGKEGALEAIERQLAAADRSVDPQHGLFLVLRLLFDPPASGSQPPMRIGIPEVLEPLEPGALPYFPLLVVDDVPLLLVTTFVLGGSAQRVEAHLEHFREHGALRDQPLQPKIDLGCATIIEHATALYRHAYSADPNAGVRAMLQDQLDRLVDSTR